jgi:hypothetical protein
MTDVTTDHLSGDVVTNAGDAAGGQGGSPPPAAPAPRTFTAEEVEKFRTDERNKLQSKLDAQNAKLEALAEAEAARANAEAEALAAQRAAAKAAEEADLDAKALLEIRTQEFEAKFAQMAEQQKQREAQLALERQFLEMKAYIQGRIAEETKTIHPTFYDYIDGASIEQVEASIALAKAKTEAMAQEIQAREQGRPTAQLQQGLGVGTATGPTSFGTVSEGGEELDFTNMSYADFVKNRSSLIKSNGNSGIFG